MSVRARAAMFERKIEVDSYNDQLRKLRKNLHNFENFKLTSFEDIKRLYKELVIEENIFVKLQAAHHAEPELIEIDEIIHAIKIRIFNKVQAETELLDGELAKLLRTDQESQELEERTTQINNMMEKLEEIIKCLNNYLNLFENLVDLSQLRKTVKEAEDFYKFLERKCAIVGLNQKLNVSILTCEEIRNSITTIRNSGYTETLDKLPRRLIDNKKRRQDKINDIIEDASTLLADLEAKTDEISQDTREMVTSIREKIDQMKEIETFFKEFAKDLSPEKDAIFENLDKVLNLIRIYSEHSNSKLLQDVKKDVGEFETVYEQLASLQPKVITFERILRQIEALVTLTVPIEYNSFSTFERNLESYEKFKNKLKNEIGERTLAQIELKTLISEGLETLSACKLDEFLTQAELSTLYEEYYKLGELIGQFETNACFPDEISFVRVAKTNALDIFNHLEKLKMEIENVQEVEEESPEVSSLTEWLNDFIHFVNI